MNIFERFHTPPRSYSPLAFWFWNGTLEPDRLRRQVDEMVDKGVYGAFMHSRGYLKTPYLEQPWWDAVDATVDQSKKRGFHPWLYDEYAWPSGTAGSTFEYGFQKPSRVLAQGEDNMAKGLSVRMVAEDGTVLSEGEGGPLVGRYAVTGSGDGMTILRLSEEEAPPAGSRLMTFRRKVYPTAVDYLNPKTIRTFMDYTHEAYKARYGEDFGGLIPGIFFDEIYMTGTPFPWTDRLPEAFAERTGQNLLALLPYLMEDGGDRGRAARLDYYRVVAQLYEEAFFAQISRWCAENHLSLTGHTEEFLAGHPKRQGNFFDTMRHLQIPGADCHDYRYRFPRKITYVEPKYAVSVARAYGRERAMSEAMGGAGWGCSLQAFKRGINTMAAMGISMFVLHGFYYECEHQGAQGDWPASFFYQNPYWKYFKRFADYISRVCLVNASGRAVVEVGLYYPIEDVQSHTVAGAPDPDSLAISRGFHAALAALLEQQIDVDFIDRRCVLAAQVADGVLHAGQQQFRILLLPDRMAPDADLDAQLARFVQAGGMVLRYQTGEAAGDAIAPAQLPQAIDAILPPDIQVLEGSRFDLYTCHREIEGKDWYFVSNSTPRPRVVTLRLRAPFAGSLAKYSLETGASVVIPASPLEGGTVVRLELEADEACYLIPSEAEAFPTWMDEEELAVAGRWDFLPLDDTYDSRYGVEATDTTLNIPLATFTSALHPLSVEIRVQNTAWEEGHCGRHLSLWSASWIGRRPTWHCNPSETDLYFRRSVSLPAAPVSARVCVAAVNDLTLWVNGQEALRAHSAAELLEVDITPYLTAGENAIAVHVHNADPLPWADLNSVEELPKDRLISLLLEGQIFLPGEETPLSLCTDADWIVSNRPAPGWILAGCDLEATAVRMDAAAASAFDTARTDGVWLYAWERGTPPLLPWGDLPLFGETVAYPVAVSYGVTIPAGASAIAMPVVRGAYTARLDGMPVSWNGASLALKPLPFARHLEIAVTAAGPQDGLRRPVVATLQPFPAALCDWRLHGLPWFSGRCLYRNCFRLQKAPGRYLLDLGQVSFYAEVWINGALVDERVWAPYRADITDALRDGENTVSIVVANAAAVERRHMLVDEGQALGWARYWNRDNMDREGENLVSGLQGPVRIFHQRQAAEQG